MSTDDDLEALPGAVPTELEKRQDRKSREQAIEALRECRDDDALEIIGNLVRRHARRDAAFRKAQKTKA